ncbi:hypothetical protein [Maribacter polysaccharolyticus]|uniref:hypothetical protein n=1 Tax=Maribacter polysaccharolyticus TaxID=3020831 RepID=UPI00237F4862|nr:hypothetical protein [Maribacter polysaccharolyticus]MDE3744057.1 hypothetical protein [Maribacter polysaccharolyticus]
MKEPDIKEIPIKNGSLKFYQDIHGHWVMVKDISLEETEFEHLSEAQDYCRQINDHLQNNITIRPLSLHPTRICLDIPLHAEP